MCYSVSLFCRKSGDVSWVDVDMPNNKTRRVWEVEEVREIAKKEPYIYSHDANSTLHCIFNATDCRGYIKLCSIA